MTLSADKSKHLEKISDKRLEITGASSAGLPGRTVGEHIGGMWNSTAKKKKNRSDTSETLERERKIR